MEQVEKGEPLEDTWETKYFSVVLEKREVKEMKLENSAEMSSCGSI